MAAQFVAAMLTDSSTCFTKADGTACNTVEENAERAAEIGLIYADALHRKYQDTWK